MTTIELSAKIFKARADNPAMAARIDKAARLVARHLADRAGRWIVAHIGPDGETWDVTGESGKVYHVHHAGETWGCDCPDCVNRRVACGHILSVRILQWAIEPGQTAPAAPSLADDRRRRDERSAQLEAAAKAERRARRPRDRAEEV